MDKKTKALQSTVKAEKKGKPLVDEQLRHNAAEFVIRWKGTTSEVSEAQSFTNEFFKIFGLDRKKIAEFELHPGGKKARADCLWKGRLLIEMKSAGESLDDAMEQAMDYYKELPKADAPDYIMACDFAKFMLRDKIDNSEYAFALEDLPDNMGLFGFMLGRPKVVHTDPVNLQATEMITEVFEYLRKKDYPSHDLPIFLTRLVFCLFADDTGIFMPRNKFQRLMMYTKEDGSDLGPRLMQLFETLDEKIEERMKIDDDLTEFPYVNGKLFQDPVRTPRLDGRIRTQIISAGEYDWSKVSPAIFGSMFENVMNPNARHKHGAHYTSEANILRVIRPLFMEGLNAEFDEICGVYDDTKLARLSAFRDRLAGLRFLDPACGSGNFLVIAYREIRRLEHRCITRMRRAGAKLDIAELSKVQVSQFHGIEYLEFSVRIAEVALWMMDHLMNKELSERYGEPYRRIPIQEKPTIVWADALRMDWSEMLLTGGGGSYILGNPPFGGSKQIHKVKKDKRKKADSDDLEVQDVEADEQTLLRESFNNVFDSKTGTGGLDYVTAWFVKAGRHAGEHTRIGLVATNSITQGQQVGQLWPELYKQNLEIIFAYKSFKWTSATKYSAAVIVIIMGLQKKSNNASAKTLYSHTKNDEMTPRVYAHISPYLIGSDTPLPIVYESSSSLNGLPKMVMGSKPIDDGNYILTEKERDEYVKTMPKLKPFIHPYLDARSFLHGKIRYILALQDADPSILNMSEISKRVEAVRAFREKSTSGSTGVLPPLEYHLTVIPEKPFLVIPNTTSEKRAYVPIAYLDPPTIPSNAHMVIEKASIPLFGLVTSRMHMCWLHAIGGRLKNDVRYSKGLVYNTFPVPKDYSSLKDKAQYIRDVRKRYKKRTFADLYSNMPKDLIAAHKALDKAVDRLYREEPFEDDSERLEFLLNRYARMLAEVGQTTLGGSPETAGRTRKKPKKPRKAKNRRSKR